MAGKTIDESKQARCHDQGEVKDGLMTALVAVVMVFKVLPWLRIWLNHVYPQANDRSVKLCKQLNNARSGSSAPLME